MHQFTIYHFGVAFMAMSPAYFILAKITDQFKVSDNVLMNIARTVAALYVGMIVANLALDHHFKVGKIGVATMEANHDVRDLWRWGKMVRKEYG
ncbi:hypothetical protein [Rhodopila sp.]|uniref:hypothetical protein n=1 Tax=Rhodopila sp. TaxID=2480087 RepID=UPI003D141E45